MVIHDLHVFRACFAPMKTDAPLIVDPNAVLAAAFAFERFKTIAGRHTLIIQTSGDFELSEFPPRHRLDIHKASYAAAPGKGFGIIAFE